MAVLRTGVRALEPKGPPVLPSSDSQRPVHLSGRGLGGVLAHTCSGSSGLGRWEVAPLGATSGAGGRGLGNGDLELAGMGGGGERRLYMGGSKMRSETQDGLYSFLNVGERRSCKQNSAQISSAQLSGLTQ